MELVVNIEKEVAAQLSDSDDSEPAAGRSRSLSAHSVQSRACSEPEPCSDWLSVDNIVASRGYSSECEVCWADAADDDDGECENVRYSGSRALCCGAAHSPDYCPVTEQRYDVADISEFCQDSDDSASDFVASVS